MQAMRSLVSTWQLCSGGAPACPSARSPPPARCCPASPPHAAASGPPAVPAAPDGAATVPASPIPLEEDREALPLLVVLGWLGAPDAGLDDVRVFAATNARHAQATSLERTVSAAGGWWSAGSWVLRLPSSEAAWAACTHGAGLACCPPPRSAHAHPPNSKDDSGRSSATSFCCCCCLPLGETDCCLPLPLPLPLLPFKPALPSAAAASSGLALPLQQGLGAASSTLQKCAVEARES